MTGTARDVDALLKRLNALEQRVEALEAERDILRTLHRDSHIVDFGPAEAWGDCYTADGVFDARTADGKTVILSRGSAELIALGTGHRFPPEHFSEHMLIDPVIEVDGKTARSVGYAVTLNRGDQGPELAMFGRYVDQLVLDDDGRWRITERVAEMNASRRAVSADMPGRVGD